MKKTSGSRYQVTAGHCGDVGQTYQHPSGTNVGSVTNQGWVSGSPVDAEMVAISTSLASNVLYNDFALNSTVTSVENQANAVVGEQTCITGMVSGTECGKLKSNNITLSICRSNGTCHSIHFLSRATYPSASGDSGAPIYSGHKAIGIHSARYPSSTDSVFSHVSNVQSYFGVSIQTAP